MKTLSLGLFLLLVLAARGEEATNATPAAPSAVAPDAAAANALQGLRGNLQITSLQSEFDLKSNLVVYVGSVRVQATNMLLLCEWLTSTLPAQGGKIDRVVARTNVVIDVKDTKGQQLHATGEQAVYSYVATATQTNETIELTGNPSLDNPQGTLTGDVITYDVLTGRVRATNQRMSVRQDLPTATNAVTQADSATNAPATTNLPPANP